MLPDLTIPTVAPPSGSERRIIRVGMIRHFDGHAALIGFHVPSVTFPSVAGSIEIGVWGYLDRQTPLELAIITQDTLPTAPIAARSSMTW